MRGSAIWRVKKEGFPLNIDLNWDNYTLITSLLYKFFATNLIKAISKEKSGGKKEGNCSTANL